MNRSLTWLHRQTVHRKLLVAIMATCCVSMVVAGLVLHVFLRYALRQSFERDASALSDIITANCVRAVAFDDREAAREILDTLLIKDNVVGACIRLPNGERFVEKGWEKSAGTVLFPKGGSVWLGADRLLASRPLVLGGQTIGTFHLLSDFSSIQNRIFKSYALVFLLMFLGAFFLGFALTSRVRREISDPIRSLANSIKDVSETQDYSVRATQTGGREMKQLADAFNHMLERIEAGAELSKEVAERRRVELALRESEERFRTLFENSPIGLYRCSPDDRFVLANHTLIALLGYGSMEELARVDIRNQVCVEPKERVSLRQCLEQIGMVEETEVQWRRRDGTLIYVRESAKVVRDAAGQVLYFEGCVEDITARKEAQNELQRLSRELMDASRAAGMAEVATGVLHNVGNVLNSVNVSATLLQDEFSRSKISSLRQAVDMLEQNLPQLGAFLTEDTRGRLLPDFLIKVTGHVAGEHERWQGEVRQLRSNIQHMTEIVALQQNYAKVSGVVEPLDAADLLEDALRMNQAGLERHRVHIERDYSKVPTVMVDKHKVLQILINLIRNAKYALDDGPAREKELRLKIYMNGSGRVKILVQDNGVGIPKENLSRIFSHGFTTRRDGHGFGLHSGALAAKELGGSLSADSPGPGQGAVFTLELPVVGKLN